MPTAKNTVPTWDLSDLYQGTDDPALKTDQEKIEQQAVKFVTQWRGVLTRQLTSTALAQLLSEFQNIIAGAFRITCYAYLLLSTHADDPAYSSWYHNLTTWETKIRKQLLFVELELLKLPHQKLRQLSTEDAVQQFRHYLERLVLTKPHRLSEHAEHLLQDRALTGKQAFIRLFDTSTAARRYTIRDGRKTKSISEADVLQRYYHPKQAVRRDATLTLNQGLNQSAGLNTFIYNTLVHDARLDAEQRQYPSVEAIRHLENEIEQTTVNAMVTAVTTGYPLVQEYYSLKKKLLKQRALYDYDRYAPITSTSTTFTFPEAKEIVLTAFRQFSPLFAETAERFFTNKWIDAKPYPGKRGGAYCIYVTPDKHPYVLMNYTGTMNDVQTLAHELGHAVNGYLARNQAYLQFDWPLTIAETASVFAEMLVFDSLRQELTKPKERLALYTGKLEGIIATVFRQVTMYRFEQRVYAAQATQGDVPEQTISQLWQQSFREMYGTAVKQSPGSSIHWSYIPHFIHTPFYVYAYAFGELLTLSLFAVYEQERNQNFITKYMDLLHAGGSQAPKDLLQPFGIDIDDPAFWAQGMGEIEKLLIETQELSEN